MHLYRQYIQKLQNWWSPTIQLSPIQAFKAELQSSKINFTTKHSDQKIILQRLCMMYSQLISQYKNFSYTSQLPLQCIKNQNNNNSSSKVPNIYGKIKIQTDKIKCQLLITIIIHCDIQNQLPKVYIRNTQPTKMRPNHKYLQLYKPVIGGVQMKLQKVYEGKWQQYKSNNMLKLVKNCQKNLIKYFPYIKKNHNNQIDHTQIPQPVMKLRNVIDREIILQNMQSLVILKNSIHNQTQSLKQVNNEMKNMQKLNLKQVDSIQIQKGQSQQIFYLLVQQKTLKDVIIFIQQQFIKKQTKITFQQAIQNLKSIQGNLFQINYKINQITNQSQK